MQVGIRELRNGLSAYVDQVRTGAHIVVTAHGRPVARLVPIEADDPLARLIASGAVTRAAHNGPGALPRRVRAAGSVSDLVSDQRR